MKSRRRQRRIQAPQDQNNMDDPPNNAAVEQSSDVETYHPRSLHDIHHTAFLLRCVLIPDVVPHILDEAEYWLKTTAATTENKTVTEDNAGDICILSDPIETNSKHAVRKIVFVVTSRDQGHSWDHEWHGTYEHSWTWFGGIIQHKGEKDSIEVIEGEGVDNRLITNLHARRELKTHTKVFGVEHDWVRHLTNGDQVGITAHARYAAWANHLDAAEIQIFTASVH